jgi:hypothetical protein
MLKKYLLFISYYASITVVTAQIFQSPSGNSGSFNEEQKHISQCDAYAPTTPISYKFNTEARRYTYDLKFGDECWLPYGYEPGNLWQNCLSQPQCNPMWSKVGEITFIRNNWTEYHKVNVGWRTDLMPHTLKISCYFHEVPDETFNSESDLNYYFVSYYLTTINTNDTYPVDMFMSLGTLALIVNSHAVAIRKPGMIPGEKDSYLTRTFYFGDVGECVTPTNISVTFSNQTHDENGFENALNSCYFITWNITEFESGDVGDFYAEEWIRGSIPNEIATNEFIQYHENHPNKIRQKCWIKSGADITFSSGESVKLYPGFHALPGSNFRAYIDINKKKDISSNTLPVRLNLPPIGESFVDTLTTNTDFVRINSLTDVEYIRSTKSFRIYPNPHPGIFTIEWNDETISEFIIQVFNMMGKPVYTRQHAQPGKTQVDISNQAKGIYFVKLQAGDKVIKEKVVYQ